jgi:hypothetical protein
MLPKRAVRILAGHARPGTVVVRPREVQVLFADPALLTMTGDHWLINVVQVSGEIVTVDTLYPEV